MTIRDYPQICYRHNLIYEPTFNQLPDQLIASESINDYPEV
jgi:ABC-type hemin transport system substrate-binding protein